MLRNVVALVSGGGSGLGYAVARRIISAGGRVVISDVSPTGASHAKELGSSAVFAQANCLSDADVSAALDLAESTFNEPVSAAINTAGVLHAAKTLSRKGEVHPLAPFERVLQVKHAVLPK